MSDVPVIPDDIDEQHHNTRIALARRLPGGENVTTAAEADELIAQPRAEADRLEAEDAEMEADAPVSPDDFRAHILGSFEHLVAAVRGLIHLAPAGGFMERHIAAAEERMKQAWEAHFGPPPEPPPAPEPPVEPAPAVPVDQQPPQPDHTVDMPADDAASSEDHPTPEAPQPDHS